MYDAVVIGAGHNGLVAANLLADEGWSVPVLEAGPNAGGAVHSSEIFASGHVMDHFSAVLPARRRIAGAAWPEPGTIRTDRRRFGVMGCRTRRRGKR
ncbi:hypothetical protein GCM10010199_18980 [Dactylosporangium roseum]